MATYYNYISVRDQLLSARKKSKCTFDLKSGIPRNVNGLKIDEEWTAHCSDRCTPGYCVVNIHIFVNGIITPYTINLHYEKLNPVAYVYFDDDVLEILIKKKILDPTKLQVEKKASKILPSTLHI